MTNNNFNFTFGEDYKTDFTTYVNEIIAVTRAQVQAKRDFVKKSTEAHTKHHKDEMRATFTANLHADIAFEDTLANRQLRIQIIENLTDCYVAATGERPEPKQLERLTDAILNEELSDRHPDKISRTEYPFMSDWQIDVRHDGEASEGGAESVGTDGRNYRKPVRRKRSTSENIYVDKIAKIRNKQRKDKYVEFTKVQPVKRWNMYTGEVFE
ncbi:hypothetical protein [Priestia megaterium]|uniref:hypothetical protein n=1 Tax=Priestia megaterium TaxID=1404 RepID=UPI003458DC0D